MRAGVDVLDRQLGAVGRHARVGAPRRLPGAVEPARLAGGPLVLGARGGAGVGDGVVDGRLPRAVAL